MKKRVHFCASRYRQHHRTSRRQFKDSHMHTHPLKGNSIFVTLPPDDVAWIEATATAEATTCSAIVRRPIRERRDGPRRQTSSPLAMT
jgi:hypothetical protein